MGSVILEAKRMTKDEYLKLQRKFADENHIVRNYQYIALEGLPRKTVSPYFSRAVKDMEPYYHHIKPGSRIIAWEKAATYEHEFYNVEGTYYDTEGGLFMQLGPPGKPETIKVSDYWIGVCES